jgi:hypothetical protein
LLGAGLVAAAALGGGMLLAVAQEDDGGGKSAAAKVEDLARSTLTESVADKRHGILARYPQSWRAIHHPGAIALVSPAGCVTVSLSAPGKASDAKRLRDDAIKEIRGSSKNVQVSRGGGRVVGGVTMSGAALELSQGSATGRMLLLAGPGRRLTYLVQTLIRGSCTADLLQAREIVGSAQLWL